MGRAQWEQTRRESEGCQRDQFMVGEAEREAEGNSLLSRAETAPFPPLLAADMMGWCMVFFVLSLEWKLPKQQQRKTVGRGRRRRRRRGAVPQSNPGAANQTFPPSEPSMGGGPSSLTKKKGPESSHRTPPALSNSTTTPPRSRPFKKANSTTASSSLLLFFFLTGTNPYHQDPFLFHNVLIIFTVPRGTHEPSYSLAEPVEFFPLGLVR